MKHLFLINPVAGKDKNKNTIKYMIEELSQKYQLDSEIHFTVSRDDARVFTKQKCKENRESEEEETLRFYACGGDGTLNEVINGCIDYDKVEIANFPCGTGNDFLSNFGGKQKFLDIEKLIVGKISPIDILKLYLKTGDKEKVKYAVNTTSLGFDSNIAFEMNRFRKVPILKGNGLYYAALLYCLTRRLNTFVSITLECGEKIEQIKKEFLLISIGNGKEYGGGFRGMPKAEVDDGLMDLCAVTKIGRSRIISLVNLYKNGEHLDSEKLSDVLVYKQVERIRLKGESELKFSYDGECYPCDEVCVEILPRKINFICPE